MKYEDLRFSSRRNLLSMTIGLAACLAFPHALQADNSIQTIQQNGVVRGTVTDVNGEPVIGATVTQKGTNNRAATDLDGRFTLPNAAGKTLVITYVGYKTVEVTATNGIKITLQEDNNVLEQVVVVGYGTQKKATLTGAVSMVQGDEVLKGRATSNVGTALQGAIPGMTVTRGSSRPTENPKISIRGGISANSNDPLILIDGVDAYAWELNSLNPSDIESISVLKDAAASIYGARAAGGVVLVTTKRAKAGRATVTYNGSATANFVGRKYPAASGSEWARMMLMADQNDSNHPAGASSLWPIMGFSATEYEKVMNNEAFDWTNGAYKYRIDPLNADQVEAVYGTTWGTNHNISLQTGNENIKSITSLGYASDRSLITEVFDGQRKYNFRNNTDFRLGKFVTIETGVSYEAKKTDVPTYGIGFGLQDFYVFPLKTASGEKYYDNFGGNNVLAHLHDGGKTVTHDYMFRLSGKLTVDLSFINPVLNGLSFYTKGSIRQFNSNKKAQSHAIQLYDYYTDEVTNNAQVGSRSKIEQ